MNLTPALVSPPGSAAAVVVGSLVTSCSSPPGIFFPGGEVGEQVDLAGAGDPSQIGFAVVVGVARLVGFSPPGDIFQVVRLVV